MTSRQIRLFVFLIFALSVSMAFTTNAFALRPAECSPANGCISGKRPGGGTHVANSGSGAVGPRSGYGAVRFDAYEPMRNPATNSFEPCDDDEQPDRNKFSEIGVSHNFPGPFFKHKRVAITRFNKTSPLALVADKTIIGGIKPNILQAANLDFNADTGETRPTRNLTAGPTQGNPWISPNWEGDPHYCLPLKSGAVEQDLYVAKPELLLGGKNYSNLNQLGIFPKMAVGMKKAYVEVAIDETQLIQNGISLSFKLNEDDPIDVLLCDITKNRKWRADHPEAEPIAGVQEGNWLLWTFYGCDTGNKKSWPVYFDTSSVTIVEDPVTNVKSARIKVKYKKKGRYAVAIRARYIGTVDSGLPGGTSATDVTSWSNGTELYVKSVKSANRK